jgi:pSer/pThr/pTyr-binding forkhead associated (FHA) protein
MKAVLTILKGPDAGSEQAVGQGQALLVGSSAPSKFVVASDAQLAKVHFSVECLADVCRVRDLKTETGILVNGEAVREARLQDGDEITAGGTTFQVRFGEPEAVRADPGVPAEAGKASATPSMRLATPDSAQAMAAAKRDGVELRCEAETCETGLRRLQPISSRHRPLDVLHLLARTSGPYVVANLTMSGAQLDLDLGNPEYLLNWVGPEAVSVVSPVVLTMDDGDWIDRVIEGAWGQNALVCFLSRLPRGEMLQKLRDLVRHRTVDDEKKQSDSVLGYYWPAVLDMMLRSGHSSLVDPMMHGTDAVLVEARTKGGWQLFVSPDKQGWLRELGFSIVEKAPAEAG